MTLGTVTIHAAGVAFLYGVAATLDESLRGVADARGKHADELLTLFDLSEQERAERIVEMRLPGE